MNLVNLKYRLIKPSIFLIVWSCHALLSAQYSFNLLTRDDGLISNEITCTYRDSRGFLWVGTKEGLQIYNGRYFRTIRNNVLDSNSLTGDWVNSIAEDALGFIWVGTNNGICKIHPGHLRCKQYLPGQKMQADVIANFSTVIADDNGKIWALTSNYILSLYADSFICEHPVNYHGSIAKGRKNELLFVINNHIYIKNTVTHSFEEVLKENKLLGYTSMYRDVKGNYWIGTWGNGLIFCNSQWEYLQQFKWDVNPVNPSTTNIVSSICGDSSRVYVGTSAGLFIYNLLAPIDVSNPIEHLIYKPEVAHGISPGLMNHIAFDKENNIWLSTSAGLNISLALNREYTLVTNGTGFMTDWVWRNDNLITSSWYGNGLCFFNRKLNLLHTIKYLPENIKELNNSQISGLDMDAKQNLWVATFNGLVYYDVQAQRSTAYYTKKNNGWATNWLNDVWVNEQENEVWTANYDAGITRYNLSTGAVINLNTKDNSFMINDLVWSFYDKGDGDLWILTNVGLLRYNYLLKKWKGWTEVEYNGSKIAMGRTQAIVKDSRGIVWLGTENGLFIYMHNHWYFKGVENGLPERGISGIVEDKQANIWISFSNSIVHLNTATLSSFVLSTANGILLPQIHSIFMNTSLDKLYMIADNSLYELDKDQMLATHTQAPLVYLENFLINGVNYYATSDSFYIEKTDFSYQQNNVEIGFITPHIGEIGELLYSYRINGGSWSVPSENSRIILPQLPPNTYTLAIRATADGTHWSNQPLLVSFTIHPPFWSTWWFRLLVVVGVLSVIIWWVRYLSTRKMRLKILQLEKEQAIEKERSRLSRDMHDDLGSGLTKISILSEVVKKKLEKDTGVETYLENISTSSRELVQNLNNIIWSLNPGNDTLQALLAYMREYASQFLESCQVDFTFVTDVVETDQEVTEQEKRNIFLVVKESLNNAVKHGKADGIEMHIKRHPPAGITITILDNGVGIKNSNPTKGNGLKNMKRRMNEIGGEFNIEALEPRGTKVILTYIF